MNILFTLNKNISKLSWCIEIIKSEKSCKLEHGSNIEVGKDFFIEGGWDGKFEDLKFEESTFFLGTGGKIIDDKVLLATPNHPLERIYMIKNSDSLWFSNSLPLILERTKKDLKKDYLDYEKDFSSILLGVNNYTKSLPVSEGTLELFYYTNILVDNNLSITLVPKKKNIPFIDYDDYYGRINDYLELFRENVTSVFRKANKYEFITTISKGYDAAACSVLAKKHGCNIAVSFNAPEKYADDNGEDIAKLLGYEKIITDDANKYLVNEELLEVEYISSGELGTGIVFSAFNNVFEDKVVFMGERGDKIWGANRKDVNNNFLFENELYAGTSMVESRLKLGYILFPLPLFGAENWISIDEITKSDEMKLFSIGGEYDRPIPRKIIEDAGIPRNFFGVKKKGAGFNYRFDTSKRLILRMAPNSYFVFRKSYKSSNSFRKIIKFCNFILVNRNYYFNYLLQKLKINFQLKVKVTHICNPYIPNDLFHWSILEMKKRYRK